MVSNSESQGKKKRGRPTKYTSALADQICAEIADGKSLHSICKRKSMPSRDAVFSWLRLHQDFSDNYVRARQTLAAKEFEELRDLEARILAKEVDAHAGRVVLDSMKWRLARMDPKVYGDRAQVDIGGGLEVGSRNLADGAPQWIKDRISKTSSPDPGAVVAASIGAGIAASNPSKTKH